MRLKKFAVAALILLVVVPAMALALSPPVGTIVINGHTYTNSNWEANFQGTLSSLTADIVAIASSTGVSGVATNSALKGLTAGTYLYMVRQGFAASGDGGRAEYKWSEFACPLNGGTGDDGTQVAPNAGTGCWLLVPPSGRYDIRLWGCFPNPDQDIIPCMTKAAAAGITDVHVPAGVWEVQTAGTFSSKMPAFWGVGWAEFNQNAACPTSSSYVGTWLHRGRNHTGITPFTISGTKTTSGNGGFKNIAYCEDHPSPGRGWAPAAYNPWFVVAGVGGQLDFTDNYLYAIYEFMQAADTISNGRLNFKGTRGQPFLHFLTADNVRDVIHGGDVHFWPYWSNDTNVLAWQQANGIPLNLARVDGIIFPDFFALGYKSCVKLGNSANGVTIGANFPAFYCDVTKYPVWVTGANTVAQFGNAYLAGGNIAGSNGVQIEASARGAQIQMANYHCGGMGESCVNVTAASGSNTVSIGAGWWHDFNQDNSGKAAVRLAAGNVLKMPVTPTIGGSNHGAATFGSTSGAYYLVPANLEFAPGIAGSGAAGTVSYTVRQGWYVVNGDQVTASFQLTINTISGARGNALITGLPIVSSTYAVNPGKCSVTFLNHVTFGPGYTGLTAEVSPNDTKAQILEYGAAASPQTQNLPVANLVAGSLIGGLCTYRIF